MGNLWRRFRRKSVSANNIGVASVQVKTFKKKVNRYNALHLRQSMKPHKGRICVVAFNTPTSDEKPLLLATAGEDAVINIWELNTNRRLRRFRRNSKGQTYLHIVSMYSMDLNFVKFLVEHGADPRVKDNKGKTAIDVAKAMFEVRKIFSSDNAKYKEILQYEYF